MKFIPLTKIRKILQFYIQILVLHLKYATIIFQIYTFLHNLKENRNYFIQFVYCYGSNCAVVFNV